MSCIRILSKRVTHGIYKGTAQGQALRPTVGGGRARAELRDIEDIEGPSKPTQCQVEDTTGSKITKHGRSSDQRRLDCGREDYLSDVSIILPVHNAERWLDQCLESVLDQDFQGSMQLSVFNDASKDNSMNIIEKWQTKLVKKGVDVVIGGHESPCPKGVGFARNQAIAQSFGRFLCFLDADDVMMPQRVRVQYDAALIHPHCVIGCQVKREPEASTERYTRWINSLTQEQLLTQMCFCMNRSEQVIYTRRKWYLPGLWFEQQEQSERRNVLTNDCQLLLYFHPAVLSCISPEQRREWQVMNSRAGLSFLSVLLEGSTFALPRDGPCTKSLGRHLAAFQDLSENSIILSPLRAVPIERPWILAQCQAGTGSASLRKCQELMIQTEHSPERL
ncbi:uncharacterized protein LOC144594733 [Rhinoraja longicauda]